MGIAWDINYFTKLGDDLDIRITNNYGSPDIPGRKQGLLNINSLIRYKFKLKKELLIRYINSTEISITEALKATAYQM